MVTSRVRTKKGSRHSVSGYLNTDVRRTAGYAYYGTNRLLSNSSGMNVESIVSSGSLTVNLLKRGMVKPTEAELNKLLATLQQHAPGVIESMVSMTAQHGPYAAGYVGGTALYETTETAAIGAATGGAAVLLKGPKVAMLTARLVKRIPGAAKIAEVLVDRVAQVGRILKDFHDDEFGGIPIPGGLSPRRGKISPALDDTAKNAQIQKVVDSFDRTGRPPQGVLQGRMRGRPRGEFGNAQQKLPVKSDLSQNLS